MMIVPIYQDAAGILGTDISHFCLWISIQFQTGNF